MSETKVIIDYVDQSFGFDFIIPQAPMIKIQGEWVLAIPYKKMRDVVLATLALHQGPLTSNQLRAIRLILKATKADFAELCGVSTAALSMWEAHGDQKVTTDALVTRRIQDLALRAVSTEGQQALIKLLAKELFARLTLAQIVTMMIQVIWTDRSSNSQDSSRATQKLLLA